MIIIPYEVDVPFNHRPWANYIVIALAIIAFVVQYVSMVQFNVHLDGETVRILADKPM